ncbi:MAG: hypothetical protein NTV80_22975, partial [Verrucomicrobia bacterium]|nr:hypothetical protein [Verrucomicrobiota bacterium]
LHYWPEFRGPPQTTSAAKKLAEVKVDSMTVIDGVVKVKVRVSDSESRRRDFLLPFEKDTAGNQLISATLDAEKGTFLVTAMIHGERHTLTQVVTQVVKQRTSSPSAEVRKKYESFSDAAKGKLRDKMRALSADEKFRNSPSEERKKVMRSVFEEIEKEDKLH